ncbi:MAG: alcohol dehydrogenase family protein [Thermus sp.]|uniref:alcohol dehydrogenase family protein n=1 Tax=unclassified Thermus TaxID=2619321 RepID=UPI0002389D8C|nr:MULTISPECIES: alcohol dehydrogenase family protein [unclassified Thermus]AEV15476.1 Alcohol dehydrogenase GroES domain protein [Thermus sp. CCB_US3_UF1]MCS6868261.1 alcohol dehydrogenase family protein [Thermus sp.]MCS7218672.1 alcohol dehydrogenase family protein [Thermus sp.]MCX7848582.1 alcohol dehydrogenase family protein [Thermus sp.]MDW8017865.1 alcohol dehydrogenase family protein [Thermus sp.]
MRAVVYQGPFQVAVEEVPEPRLEGEGEAIVEVELSAICGSDLHIYHGKIAGVLPGTVLGHEFVGRVVEKGPLVPWALGERVVGSFQVACGECPACRRGQYFACLKGGVYGFGLALGNLPGAQAQRVRVPFARHSLFPIGDLPAEEAILAGDILTTAYGGVRPFLTPGMSVAVVGSGPVGLMAQAVAHALGAGPVFAIDPEESRLEKAQALGSLPVNPKAEDPVARVRKETEGLGAELVVEAVGGDGEALKLALRLAGPGGVVSSLGVPTAERLDYPWLPAFSRGITLRSALANIPRWIGEVLALQRVGRLRGSFVFSHRLPLGEAAEGYRLFHERRATKVALVP